MPLSVNIDTSFIVPLLKHLSKPSKESLIEITNHEAAKKTYSHAVRTRNTTKSISSFWKEIMNKLSKSKNLIDYVKQSLTFIHNETNTFDKLLKELWNEFPEGTHLRSVLYANLGYDIGIVSEGCALINIGHKDYHKNPQEILYMSMHELHHVVYTAYNSFFDLTQVNRFDQLCDIVRYCTHMEGLAIYSTLKPRRAANVLNNRDYKLFLDEKARKKRVSEYFDLLTELEIRGDAPLQENDWAILERMTDRNRLWYVAGAHMSQLVEEKLGHETLVDTIRLGPEYFFKIYHESF
ncbi:MAG: DUF5700 domain-containing putative Zn-dependent protease [Candidatus Thorarchaeota archaeon]